MALIKSKLLGFGGRGGVNPPGVRTYDQQGVRLVGGGGVKAPMSATPAPLVPSLGAPVMHQQTGEGLAESDYISPYRREQLANDARLKERRENRESLAQKSREEAARKEAAREAAREAASLEIAKAEREKANQEKWALSTYPPNDKSTNATIPFIKSLVGGFGLGSNSRLQTTPIEATPMGTVTRSNGTVTYPMGNYTSPLPSVSNNSTPGSNSRLQTTPISALPVGTVTHPNGSLTYPSHDFSKSIPDTTNNDSVSAVPVYLKNVLGNLVQYGSNSRLQTTPVQATDIGTVVRANSAAPSPSIFVSDVKNNSNSDDVDTSPPVAEFDFGKNMAYYGLIDGPSNSSGVTHTVIGGTPQTNYISPYRREQLANDARLNARREEREAINRTARDEVARQAEEKARIEKTRQDEIARVEREKTNQDKWALSTYPPNDKSINATIPFIKSLFGGFGLGSNSRLQTTPIEATPMGTVTHSNGTVTYPMGNYTTPLTSVSNNSTPGSNSHLQTTPIEATPMGTVTHPDGSLTYPSPDFSKSNPDTTNNDSVSALPFYLKHLGGNIVQYGSNSRLQTTPVPATDIGTVVRANSAAPSPSTSVSDDQKINDNDKVDTSPPVAEFDFGKNMAYYGYADSPQNTSGVSHETLAEGPADNIYLSPYRRQQLINESVLKERREFRAESAIIQAKFLEEKRIREEQRAKDAEAYYATNPSGYTLIDLNKEVADRKRDGDVFKIYGTNEYRRYAPNPKDNASEDNLPHESADSSIPGKNVRDAPPKVVNPYDKSSDAEKTGSVNADDYLSAYAKILGISNPSLRLAQPILEDTLKAATGMTTSHFSPEYTRALSQYEKDLASTVKMGLTDDKGVLLPNPEYELWATDYTNANTKYSEYFTPSGEIRSNHILPSGEFTPALINYVTNTEHLQKTAEKNNWARDSGGYSPYNEVQSKAIAALSISAEDLSDKYDHEGNLLPMHIRGPTAHDIGATNLGEGFTLRKLIWGDDAVRPMSLTGNNQPPGSMRYGTSGIYDWSLGARDWLGRNYVEPSNAGVEYLYSKNIYPRFVADLSLGASEAIMAFPELVGMTAVGMEAHLFDSNPKNFPKYVVGGLSYQAQGMAQQFKENPAKMVGGMAAMALITKGLGKAMPLKYISTEVFIGGKTLSRPTVTPQSYGPGTVTAGVNRAQVNTELYHILKADLPSEKSVGIKGVGKAESLLDRRISALNKVPVEDLHTVLSKAEMDKLNLAVFLKNPNARSITGNTIDSYAPVGVKTTQFEKMTNNPHWRYTNEFEKGGRLDISASTLGELTEGASKLESMGFGNRSTIKEITNPSGKQYVMSLEAPIQSVAKVTGIVYVPPLTTLKNMLGVGSPWKGSVPIYSKVVIPKYGSQMYRYAAPSVGGVVFPAKNSSAVRIAKLGQDAVDSVKNAVSDKLPQNYGSGVTRAQVNAELYRILRNGLPDEKLVGKKEFRKAERLLDQRMTALNKVPVEDLHTAVLLSKAELDKLNLVRNAYYMHRNAKAGQDTVGLVKNVASDKPPQIYKPGTAPAGANQAQVRAELYNILRNDLPNKKWVGKTEFSEAENLLNQRIATLNKVPVEDLHTVLSKAEMDKLNHAMFLKNLNARTQKFVSALKGDKIFMEASLGEGRIGKPGIVHELSYNERVARGFGTTRAIEEVGASQNFIPGLGSEIMVPAQKAAMERYGISWVDGNGNRVYADRVYQDQLNYLNANWKGSVMETLGDPYALIDSVEAVPTGHGKAILEIIKNADRHHLLGGSFAQNLQTRRGPVPKDLDMFSDKHKKIATKVGEYLSKELGEENVIITFEEDMSAVHVFFEDKWHALMDIHRKGFGADDFGYKTKKQVVINGINILPYDTLLMWKAMPTMASTQLPTSSPYATLGFSARPRLMTSSKPWRGKDLGDTIGMAEEQVRSIQEMITTYPKHGRKHAPRLAIDARESQALRRTIEPESPLITIAGSKKDRKVDANARMATRSDLTDNPILDPRDTTHMNRYRVGNVPQPPTKIELIFHPRRILVKNRRIEDKGVVPIERKRDLLYDMGAGAGSYLLKNRREIAKWGGITTLVTANVRALKNYNREVYEEALREGESGKMDVKYLFGESVSKAWAGGQSVSKPIEAFTVASKNYERDYAFAIKEGVLTQTGDLATNTEFIVWQTKYSDVVTLADSFTTSGGDIKPEYVLPSGEYVPAIAECQAELDSLHKTALANGWYDEKERSYSPYTSKQIFAINELGKSSNILDEMIDESGNVRPQYMTQLHNSDLGIHDGLTVRKLVYPLAGTKPTSTAGYGTSGISAGLAVTTAWLNEHVVMPTTAIGDRTRNWGGIYGAGATDIAVGTVEKLSAFPEGIGSVIGGTEGLLMDTSPLSFPLYAIGGVSYGLSQFNREYEENPVKAVGSTVAVLGITYGAQKVFPVKYRATTELTGGKSHLASSKVSRARDIVSETATQRVNTELVRQKIYSTIKDELPAESTMAVADYQATVAIAESRIFELQGMPIRKLQKQMTASEWGKLTEALATDNPNVINKKGNINTKASVPVDSLLYKAIQSGKDSSINAVLDKGGSLRLSSGYKKDLIHGADLLEDYGFGQRGRVQNVVDRIGRDVYEMTVEAPIPESTRLSGLVYVPIRTSIKTMFGRSAPWVGAKPLVVKGKLPKYTSNEFRKLDRNPNPNDVKPLVVNGKPSESISNAPPKSDSASNPVRETRSQYVYRHAQEASNDVKDLIYGNKVVYSPDAPLIKPVINPDLSDIPRPFNPVKQVIGGKRVVYGLGTARFLEEFAATDGFVPMGATELMVPAQLRAMTRNNVFWVTEEGVETSSLKVYKDNLEFMKRHWRGGVKDAIMNPYDTIETLESIPLGHGKAILDIVKATDKNHAVSGSASHKTQTSYGPLGKDLDIYTDKHALMAEKMGVYLQEVLGLENVRTELGEVASSVSVKVDGKWAKLADLHTHEFGGKPGVPIRFGYPARRVVTINGIRLMSLDEQVMRKATASTSTVVVDGTKALTPDGRVRISGRQIVPASDAWRGKDMGDYISIADQQNRLIDEALSGNFLLQFKYKKARKANLDAAQSGRDLVGKNSPLQKITDSDRRGDAIERMEGYTQVPDNEIPKSHKIPLVEKYYIFGEKSSMDIIREIASPEKIIGQSKDYIYHVLDVGGINQVITPTTGDMRIVVPDDAIIRTARVRGVVEHVIYFNKNGLRMSETLGGPKITIFTRSEFEAKFLPRKKLSPVRFRVEVEQPHQPGVPSILDQLTTQAFPSMIMYREKGGFPIGSQKPELPSVRDHTWADVSGGRDPTNLVATRDKNVKIHRVNPIQNLVKSTSKAITSVNPVVFPLDAIKKPSINVPARNTRQNLRNRSAPTMAERNTRMAFEMLDTIDRGLDFDNRLAYKSAAIPIGQPQGPSGKQKPKSTTSVGNVPLNEVSLKDRPARLYEGGGSSNSERMAGYGLTGANKYPNARTIGKYIPLKSEYPVYPQYTKNPAYPFTYQQYPKYPENGPYPPYPKYPENGPYPSYPKYPEYGPYSPYSPYSPYGPYSPYSPYAGYAPATTYPTIPKTIPHKEKEIKRRPKKRRGKGKHYEIAGGANPDEVFSMFFGAASQPLTLSVPPNNTNVASPFYKSSNGDSENLMSKLFGVSPIIKPMNTVGVKKTKRATLP